MNRRQMLAATTGLAVARSLIGETRPGGSRLGLCSFSCHQHWRAVGAKHAGVRFTDAPGFFRYARDLGGEGVQTALRGTDAAVARRIRELVEQTGGYYEGELRLPADEGDLGRFETDVRLAHEAGAAVARAFFTIHRRYEQFASREQFAAFHERCRRTLRLVEPVMRRYRVKLAIENHKDLTTEELAAMMREFGGEWIGVLVDTGNNLALLEDPHEAIDGLASWALSVHLKDMAVQPYEEGFLLSEVPLGTGLLDLPRMVQRLRQANPGIVLNLEMATRDPLRIPCQTDGYYATFAAGYRERRLAAALARVQANPPRGPVPIVTGRPLADVLAEEEKHNRECLDWMRRNLRA